ncbi:MAG: hypothetical protein ACK5N0_11595 [Synechococcaceae cyanobacterium]
MSRLLLVGFLLLQGALASDAKPLQPIDLSQPLPSSTIGGPRRASIIPANSAEAAVNTTNRPRRLSPGLNASTANGEVLAESTVTKP